MRERLGSKQKATGFLRKLAAFIMVFALVAPAALTTVEAKADVTLNVAHKTLYTGEQFKLEPYGTTKAVAFTSSDTKIATVAKDGTVTAVKAGTATITATSDSKKYTCEITVKDPYFDKKDVTTEIGQKVFVRLVGSKIKEVKTSDSKVCTAKIGNYATPYDDEYFAYYDDYYFTGEPDTGIYILGCAKGSATITVTAENSKTYTIKATVTEPYVVVSKKTEYSKNGSYNVSNTEYQYNKNGLVVLLKYSYENSNSKNEKTSSQSEEAYTYYPGTEQKKTYSDSGESNNTYYEYDEQGRNTKRIYTYPSGEREEYAYTYDANGNQTYAKGVSYDSKGKQNWSYETKTEFNEYNLATKCERYSDGKYSDGNISYYIGVKENGKSYETGKTYYSYDICLEVPIDSKGKITDGYKVTFDKNGRLTKYEGGKNSYNGVMSFKYDAAGNLTYVEEYDSDGDFSYSKEYKYDKEGRRTSELCKYSSGSSEERVTVYTKSGLVQSETCTKTDRRKNVTKTVNTNTYDSADRLLKVEEDTGDTVEIYEYEYNKYGKLVKCTGTTLTTENPADSNYLSYDYDDEWYEYDDVTDSYWYSEKSDQWYDDWGFITEDGYYIDEDYEDDYYAGDYEGEYVGIPTLRPSIIEKKQKLEALKKEAEKSKVTRPDGRVMYSFTSFVETFDYDKYGNKSLDKIVQYNLTDESVTELKYKYDADGNLLSESSTGSYGNFTAEYKYTNGVMTYQKRDYGDGSVTEVTYDTQGRTLLSKNGSDTTKYEYFDTYYTIESTSQYSDTKYVYYSAYDLETKEKLESRSAEYNSKGKKISEYVDSYCKYDDKGRIIERSKWDGYSVKYTYDDTIGKVIKEERLPEDTPFSYDSEVTTYTYKLLSKVAK